MPRLTTTLPGCLLLLAVSIGTGTLLNGCAEEPPPPPKKVQQPPPPPPPTVATVAELMLSMQIDRRVRMAEHHAPLTEEERRGMLTFFDAWVRGDHQVVGSMVGSADRAELTAMIEDGQWEANTGEAIGRVGVRTGPSREGGGQCVLAIYEVGSRSQLQLWNYSGRGERMIFEAVATPPGMMDRLSGDMIANWWEILEDEKELWAIPDEQLADLMAEDAEEEEASSGSNVVGPAAGGSGRRGPGGGKRGPGGGKRGPGGGRLVPTGP